MKFTVELEEFYLDSDSGAIEDELKKHVTNSVVAQINKQISAKVEEEIARKVKQVVEDTLVKKITNKVTSLIEGGKIRPDRGGEEMSMLDYVKKEFENHSGWRSPYQAVCDAGKKWGDEMKMRYDKAFAVQVVETMRKNNLLKEDSIARLLLESVEEKKSA